MKAVKKKRTVKAVCMMVTQLILILIQIQAHWKQETKYKKQKKKLEHFLEQKVVVDQQNIFDHCKHFESFS